MQIPIILTACCNGAWRSENPPPGGPCPEAQRLQTLLIRYLNPPAKGTAWDTRTTKRACGILSFDNNNV